MSASAIFEQTKAWIMLAQPLRPLNLGMQHCASRCEVSLARSFPLPRTLSLQRIPFIIPHPTSFRSWPAGGFRRRLFSFFIFLRRFLFHSIAAASLFLDFVG